MTSLRKPCFPSDSPLIRLQAAVKALMASAPAIPGLRLGSMDRIRKRMSGPKNHRRQQHCSLLMILAGFLRSTSFTQASASEAMRSCSLMSRSCASEAVRFMPSP